MTAHARADVARSLRRRSPRFACIEVVPQNAKRAHGTKRTNMSRTRRRRHSTAHSDLLATDTSPVLEFGIDEAGRGPLAGPVVCAACYLPSGTAVEGVVDSKKISSEEAREVVYERLISTPGVRYAISKCEPALIDKVNILQATLATMRLAGLEMCRKLSFATSLADDDVLLCEGVEAALPTADFKGQFLALVDGNHDPWKAVDVRGLASRTVIGGDASIQAIAAASIIAKVTRDRIMHKLDQEHPEYGFGKHKGYGTRDHIRIIMERGWLPSIHRTSFNPVRSMLGNAVNASEGETTMGD